MTTYILGNSIKKRAQFSRINNDNELYIDDMRVLFDLIKDGTYFYAIEGRLFKNMQVGDYVAYSRSLFDKDVMDKKHIKVMLKSVGYKGLLKRKLKTISDSDYVKVLLCSRIKETTNTVFLNLDDWKYTKINYAKMQKLICDLSAFSLCILVSDIRFCRQEDRILYLNLSKELVQLDGEYRRKKTGKRRILSMLKQEKSEQHARV